MKVVIVGGGIAGLAAAWRLRQRAPGTSLTLLEAAPRLGGKIVTERVDGFVIEGGPDCFLSYKPRGVGLCRELGLADRLQGANPALRRTYVMRRGRLYELPEGLTGLIPARFGPMIKSGLISPLGKLRMALDYVLPPCSVNGDESLAAFVERRLGREVYARLVEPLLSGIYAGDGAQLSLQATFPQLRQAELDHGSLIRGMLAARRTGAAGRAGPAFVTPQAGLAEVVEALRARLDGVDVQLETPAARIESGEGPYRVFTSDGRAWPADALILAAPAYVSAGLVRGLDPSLADTLDAIPHVSTATISLAYSLRDVPRPLDGAGYVIPRAEGRPILACTWTSTKFPHRAPDGFVLIRAFVGRAGQEGLLERLDGDLLEIARIELRRTLGIAAAPALHRVFRWPRAMPQYTLGHPERLRAIENRLAALPGLFLAGNAYHGVGIPDCIASGERAAEKIVERL